MRALWSDTQNCSRNVSQKVKRIRCLSEYILFSCQADGKGGLSLRGVAFMTVLAVLAVLERTLPSSCLSYKIQCKETTVTVLTVLAVVAVPLVTATPLKLNPPFPSS